MLKCSCAERAFQCEFYYNFLACAFFSFIVLEIVKEEWMALVCHSIDFKTGLSEE